VEKRGDDERSFVFSSEIFGRKWRKKKLCIGRQGWIIFPIPHSLLHGTDTVLERSSQP
jgi:hypothetical protein